MKLNKVKVVCLRCGKRIATNGSLCSECIKEIEKQLDLEM